MAKKAIYARYQVVEGSYLEWYLEYEYSRYNYSTNFQSGDILWQHITIDPVSGVLYCAGQYCSQEDFRARRNKFDPVWQDRKVRKISHTNPIQGGSGWGSDQVSYVQRQRTVYTYSKGSYLTDVIAEYGSLPADGRHTDGYWYVFVKMASDLKANVGGIWRDAPTGYSNEGGIWRQQSELKANVEGIFK